MRIAVLGPITKDIIIVNGVKNTYIGGVPYYVAKALKALGAEVKVFGTYSEEDKDLIENNFKDIELKHFPVEGTIIHQLSYNTDDPDHREVVVPQYDPNIFRPDENLLKEIKKFDYIILGPLYFENIPF